MVHARWYPKGRQRLGGSSALAIAIYLDGSDDPDRAEDGALMLDDDFLVMINAWRRPSINLS